MRIPNSIFKYVEHELYSYAKTKKELEQARKDILEETHVPEVPSQANLGDSTATKAIKLTTSTYIMRGEKVIKAIDSSLQKLADRHRDLFEYRYRRGLSRIEVALEMDISERTYYRIRREIVVQVAQALGLLNIE